MARDKVRRVTNRSHVSAARQDGTPTGTGPGETSIPPVPGRRADRKASGPPAINEGEEAPPWEPALPGVRGRTGPAGAPGAPGAPGRAGRNAAPVPEFEEPYIEIPLPGPRGLPGAAGAGTGSFTIGLYLGLAQVTYRV